MPSCPSDTPTLPGLLQSIEELERDLEGLQREIQKHESVQKQLAEKSKVCLWLQGTHRGQVPSSQRGGTGTRIPGSAGWVGRASSSPELYHGACWKKKNRWQSALWGCWVGKSRMDTIPGMKPRQNVL